MNGKPKAVVLLSGGQDSTTCFYYALREYDVVAAVSFDYGQRHKIELACARGIAESEQVEHVVLDVPALRQLGQASLTNPEIPNDVSFINANAFAAERGLPPSFVPGRNLLFFTMGAAVAAKYDAPNLVTGVCQQDRAGYPDCRAEFVDAMEETIAVGFDWPLFTIDAPLLHLSKADTWALAAELGVVDRIQLSTHTCYEGDHTPPPKLWGYGCGECPACLERIRGYEEWRTRLRATARG